MATHCSPRVADEAELDDELEEDEDDGDLAHEEDSDFSDEAEVVVVSGGKRSCYSVQTLSSMATFSPPFGLQRRNVGGAQGSETNPALARDGAPTVASIACSGQRGTGGAAAGWATQSRLDAAGTTDASGWLAQREVAGAAAGWAGQTRVQAGGTAAASGWAMHRQGREPIGIWADAVDDGAIALHSAAEDEALEDEPSSEENAADNFEIVEPGVRPTWQSDSVCSQLAVAAAGPRRAHHPWTAIPRADMGAIAASQTRRRKTVRFGDVQVLYHEALLDDSKLPSDGLAPVGLGVLKGRELRRLDSYEGERQESRRGVSIIPPEDRREVVGVKRRASLERIERDNAKLRMAHVQSIRDHISELRTREGGAEGGRIRIRLGRRSSSSADSADAAAGPPAATDSAQPTRSTPTVSPADVPVKSPAVSIPAVAVSPSAVAVSPPAVAVSPPAVAVSPPADAVSPSAPAAPSSTEPPFEGEPPRPRSRRRAIPPR